MFWLCFATAFFVIACIAYLILYIAYSPAVLSIETIGYHPTILVPGAGLEQPNIPSDILKDRLLTAADLIYKHRPAIIVLSGASNQKTGNETRAMELFLHEIGITGENIQQDEKGYSTFHSFINIRESTAQQPVVIVSQRFHLTRALMIASLMGISCYGVASNALTFSPIKIMYWYFREIIATPYNIGKIIVHRILHLKHES
jgi:vancomycin permeability regulator SanA